MQLVIDLPPRDKQLAFNRRRWEEICADPDLARFPGKVESNAFGQVIMMPPASGSHSNLQGEIVYRLRQTLGGRALPECPISTIDGVRAADVGWYSEDRFANVEGQIAFEIAPEICVEIVSPGNSRKEMEAKRRLYFEAGAEEVWICTEDGKLQFFLKASPENYFESSTVCPDFPPLI